MLLLVPESRSGESSPPNGSSRSITVEQIWNIFRVHGLRGLAPATVNTYQQYLGKQFIPRFGSTKVAELSMLDVFQWLGEHDGWKSESTFATVHKVLRRLFNWAVRFQLIATSPVAGLEMPRDTQRRNWTDREFIRVVRNTTPAFKRLLYFCAWTGSRPGEAIAIQWSDIDFERSCVVLRKHKTATTTKQRKPRTIVLIPVAVRLLHWIRCHRQYHAGRVFLNDHERPWTTCNVCRRLDRVKRRLGLSKEVKPYGLRHLYGTNAIRRGLDIKTLSLLLGHESVRLTERYVHLAGDTGHLLSAAIRATGKVR